MQWNPYFDHSKDVPIGQNTFHVYIKGTEGPLLVLLHGGGYSGLTWAELTVGIIRKNFNYTHKKKKLIHGMNFRNRL